MQTTAVYYHNPKCSKSRQGLEALIEKGIQFDIREYLKSPLSQQELMDLLQALPESDLSNILRRKDSLYKELSLTDKPYTIEELASLLVEHPALMERPILKVNSQARIGRPTEALFEACH